MITKAIEARADEIKSLIEKADKQRDKTNSIYYGGYVAALNWVLGQLTTGDTNG